MQHPRRSVFARSSLVLLALLLAATAGSGVAQEAALVRDIEGTGQGWEPDDVCGIPCPPVVLHGSAPYSFTQVGDLVFFGAFDFEAGQELWVTDGTTGTTRRVADLCPGACDADPRLYGAVNGELLFWATEQLEGPDDHGSYFFTDGTSAGTRRLDGLCDGRCDSDGHKPGVHFDGSLFFSGPSTESSGNLPALWRTDGTAAGTAPVSYLPHPLALPVDLTVGDIERSAVLGDALFVVRKPNFFNNWERSALFRLRAGEEMATEVLANCRERALSPRQLRPSDAGLGFVSGCLDRADLRVADVGIFITDGTAAGTQLLFDGRRARGDGRTLELLGWLDGGLWFAANDESSASAELWRSDGTPEGTVRMLEGLPEVKGGVALPDRLLLLTSNDPPLGSGLWSSDGTAAGTWEMLSAGVSAWKVVGRRVLFSAVDEAGREPWVSDGTVAGTRRLADVNPGPADSDPGGFAGGDRIYFAADDGVHDREPWSFPASLVNPDRCVTAGDSLCLAAGRFKARVRFRNQHAGGAEGTATAVAGTENAGFFWFFRQDNLELMVKVLDGSSVNGHHWVFYGGITDLEYDLEVTDLVSGETRTWHHAPGDLCGGADTRAFPAVADDGVASAAGEPVAPSPHPSPLTPVPCGNSDTQLCIGGSFQTFGVTVTYRNQYDGGAAGSGMAMPMGSDSGWFWFFHESNPEMMVKVLDGTAVNGHHWVFVGGLSTVEAEVTVTDHGTAGSPTRTYVKAAGSTCGFADVTAFPVD